MHICIHMIDVWNKTKRAKLALRASLFVKINNDDGNIRKVVFDIMYVICFVDIAEIIE